MFWTTPLESLTTALPETPLIGVRIYIPNLKLKLPFILPDIDFDDLREVGAVHAGGTDAHQQLALARDRIGALPPFELAVDDGDGAHRRTYERWSMGTYLRSGSPL